MFISNPALFVLFLLSSIHIFASSWNSTSDLYLLDQATQINVAPAFPNYSFSFDDNTLPSSSNDTNFQLDIGSAYTFLHNGAGHPFIIYSQEQLESISTINDASTANPDAWSRTSFSGSATSTLLISGNAQTWTPTEADLGTYYYVCGVGSHGSMMGQISVVPEPATAALLIGLFLITYSVARRSRS